MIHMPGCREYVDDEDDEYPSDWGEFDGDIGVMPSCFEFLGDPEIQEPVYEEFPENVEFPVSWLAGSSEPTEPEVHTKYDTHLMLYVVGEGLAFGDDCQCCPSAAIASTGTVVGSRVCPTLPVALVEEVILWLPAAAQARCRAVCKSWLAMLSNPEFLRRNFLHSLAQKPPPMCAVTFHPHVGGRKLPSERSLQLPYKALKVDLSFLPKVFHSPKSELHACSPNGLMCITRSANEGMYVCVLNPVNQSFKLLPMLEGLWGRHAVLLMGTESIPSFKVYVPLVIRTEHAYRTMGGRGFFNDVAIYSSITGEWKGLGFLGRSEPPAVACKGAFYTVVKTGTSPRLVRLSMERGPRYPWDLPLPKYDERKYWNKSWSADLFLAEHRGRLLCCRRGIWMLDDARERWVQIAKRCPPALLPPHGNKPKDPMLVLGKVQVAGDLIVFFHQVLLYRGRLDCPVAYDMLGRFWRKLPQSIAKVGDVFQPSLHLRL